MNFSDRTEETSVGKRETCNTRTISETWLECRWATTFLPLYGTSLFVRHLFLRYHEASTICCRTRGCSIGACTYFHPNGTLGFSRENGELEVRQLEHRSAASYRTSITARKSSKNALVHRWKRELIAGRALIMSPFQSLTRLLRWFFRLLSWSLQGKKF